MHTLKYRTRADSAPKGKPRIYFCCHPEDFPLYFETISNELLELWDCAVWYDPAPDAPVWGTEEEEAFADSLAEMQLFVIPVTEAFLYEANDARLREFPLARERRIPVLPILVNGGLSADFNRICGNIQFLDKTSADATEIPYREKLKKFLESILVSEELSQKVRDAFDAYVFLSYRKKDRKYAQELMRLIHKNEFCRDVAIWYDEFLAPGENFNTSIQKALESSQLFALAVTPNLVNEKNYVMDIEYPMARDAGKRIIPAELCPTDHSALKRCYGGIPDCIDGRDGDSLSASLSDALKEIALREKDGSPEHLFFIGLAYLSGIDVEVDLERGVGLIADAAERGLPQAMDKLVSLYYSGYGVALDRERAAYWQERLVQSREAEFLSAPGGEGGEALLSACGKLADLYRELQDYPRAAAACERFLRWKEESAEHMDGETARRYGLWYRDRMGRIYADQGMLAEAKKEYKEYQRLAKTYAMQYKTSVAIDTLIISHELLGDTCMAEGNLSEAGEEYAEAKRIAEILDEEAKSLDSKNRRLLIDIKYARALKEQKNLSGALAQYQSLMPLAEQLSEGGAGDKDILSLCLSDMGDIYSELWQWDKAMEYYRKSLDMKREITEKEPSLGNLRGLSVAYNRYGDTLITSGDIVDRIDRGNPQEALDCYNKSLELIKPLAERTRSMRHYMDLACTYDRISRFYGTSNPQGKVDYLSLAIGAAEKAVACSGSVEAKRSLSAYYDRLGRHYGFAKDKDKERLYHKKSFELDRQIAEETQSLQDQLPLASDCQTMSNFASEDGDYEKAVEYRKRAVEICEGAAEKEPDLPVYRRRLALYLENLGHLYKRNGHPLEARDCYERSLLLSRDLAPEDVSDRGQWTLAGRYKDVADSFAEEGNWDKAITYYREYTDIYERMAKENPTEDNISRLGDAWNTRYAAAKKCGQYEEAKRCALRAMEMRDRRVEAEGDDVNLWDSALYCCRCVIEVCLLQKDFEEAKRYAQIYHDRAMEAARFQSVPRFFGGSGRAYMGTRLRMLLQIYTECGAACKKEKDYEHAKAAYMEAISYAEEFAKEFPDDADGKDRLALANYYYGDVMPDVYYVHYIREAGKLWDALHEEFPSNANFAHNSRLCRNILKE